MHLLISLLLNAAALIITAYIVPGFEIIGGVTTAILAAIVLGVINTFIKPILVILTAPLNFLTLGLFTFVINAIVLWLGTVFVKGIVLDNWLAAILAAIVLSVVSTVMSMLMKDVLKK